MPKFKAGKIYMTIGIDNALKQNKGFFKEIIGCFEKYLTGNWGNLTESDMEANNIALTNGERILGAYNTSQGKVYIITECDRSTTTILFANEY